MITTSRNVTLGCHVTQETKDEFRREAGRRRLGMSELLSALIEEWLVTAQKEKLEQVRSRKK